MSKTFLQYVGAWAPHLYPKGNKKKSTYATSGCATCMLAAIIYNVNPNITPEIVGNYISSIGGATAGGATYHSAIKKTAEHFGVSCKEIGTMSEFLKLMKTGNYWGGLLFRSGSRSGVRWTSGGHYIAATDARGTDSLYMRDSGKRKHIGWYSYNKHMKGLIKKAWVFWAPKSTPKPTPAPAPKKPSTIVEATSSGSYAVKKRAFYSNDTYGKWYKVIRAKDSTKAAVIAREALEAVGKKNIHYNTTAKGYTLPQALKKVGWDMSKVKTTVYTSCTPLAMACVLCAGVGREKDKYYQWARSSTKSIAERLTATGQFTAFDYPKGGAGLQVGDIVISKTHGVIITGVK